MLVCRICHKLIMYAVAGCCEECATPERILEAAQQSVQRTNATEPLCAIARECYFGQDGKCLRGGVCR